ncbi:MAG: hypothetical protein FJX46_03990 [Alphaproteobacteria bacterium]|nr:hypothetical protein [Alphaproteobacteria bacterium]
MSAAAPPAPSQSAAPFAIALGVGAFLLFWLQPMVAKLLLPGLGGAPGVWAVCLVFFQVALLLGYVYADQLRRRLTPRRQAWVHIALLAVAMISLPIDIDIATAPPSGARPEWWLLGKLAATVAPAFVIASATAPLLQGWFALSRRDPYFLYAASNLGSFAALLAFPLGLEPLFDLAGQKVAWTAGYGGLIALTAWCGRGLPDLSPANDATAENGWREIAHWLALAAVPSALLVGATRHISTDVAAVPLLWVIPLALYLLSFVNAFAARPWISPAWATVVAVVALALVSSYRALGIGVPRIALLVGLHCLALFALSLALHGRLAALRPPPERLSSFYVWLATGGALGGMFAALLGPVLFVTVLEYALAITAAAFLLPGRWPQQDKWLQGALDLVVPGLVALALWQWPNTGWLPEALAWTAVALAVAGLFRPLRLGLTIAILFLAGPLLDDDADLRFRARNFFGTIQVRDEGQIRLFRHGTTLHGAQSLDYEKRGQPIGYYHPLGPIGRLLMERGDGPLTSSVAVVGLGVGGLASYANAGEHWTFYEIDRDIIHMASDPRLFTLIEGAPAAIRIVEGDARLSVAREPDQQFSLIILDAFSSDSVPMHLLTLEAFEMYRRKIKPEGVILVHVSNRHLDLEPIVGRTAAALGLTARAAADDDDLPRGEADWKARTHWVFLTPRPETVTQLHDLPFWREARVAPGKPWTDRHSNLLEAIRR